MMPNITYVPMSGDTIVNNADGTQYYYNNGCVSGCLALSGLFDLRTDDE